MNGRARAGWRLVAVLAAAGAAAAVLLRSGAGALTTPPLTADARALAAWVDGRDGVTVALALARVGGLLLAAYVGTVALAGLAARLVAAVVPCAGAVVRLLDRLTPRVVRALLDTALGAGLAAGSLGIVLGPASPAVAGTAGVAAPGTVAAASAERVPTLRRVVEPVPATPTPEPAPQPGPRSATGPRPAATPTTWTVRRGEHFWAIAEAVVTQRTVGRAPAEREIARYWLRLIAANRRNLPVPGNPDLLYPGTVLVLPQ